jgi:hypothetical protein
VLEPDLSFRPARTRDGYPPLEDLGLIGDGSTVALGGGQFSIIPGSLTEARQRYEPDTVLSAWSKDLVLLEEYPAGSNGPGDRGKPASRESANPLCGAEHDHA